MSEKKKIEDTTKKANLDVSETAPVNGGYGERFNYEHYCIACQNDGLIPFSFDEWLQLGCPLEPTFKEPDD